MPRSQPQTASSDFCKSCIIRRQSPFRQIHTRRAAWRHRRSWAAATPAGLFEGAVLRHDQPPHQTTHQPRLTAVVEVVGVGQPHGAVVGYAARSTSSMARQSPSIRSRAAASVETPPPYSYQTVRRSYRVMRTPAPRTAAARNPRPAVHGRPSYPALRGKASAHTQPLYHRCRHRREQQVPADDLGVVVGGVVGRAVKGVSPGSVVGAGPGVK